jgi:hypothetical protein
VIQNQEAGSVAQVVEHLPSNHQALSTAKTNKQTNKKQVKTKPKAFIWLNHQLHSQRNLSNDIV